MASQTNAPVKYLTTVFVQKSSYICIDKYNYYCYKSIQTAKIHNRMHA